LNSKILLELRCQILKASSYSNEGHVPSAFSILEILYVIYVVIPSKHNLVMEKDYDFILSKGHGSLALYAVLNAAGTINNDWVFEFCKENSKYGGHPDKQKIPGVVASTGSLGHGLPIAVGRVLANRNKSIRQRSYCLVGDGELNEGSNWESLLLVENFNLFELCLIIDQNNSTTRAVRVTALQNKLESFGFRVVVVNGHDIEALEKVLMEPLGTDPIAIIAETTKGKGLELMENAFEWHHRSPSELELAEFLEELK
jgi:transketolase